MTVVDRIESSDHATGPDAPAPTDTITTGEDGRPSNVPEKFWDAETKTVNQDALLASYSELEKSKGAGLPSDDGGEPAPNPVTKDPADPVTDDPEKDAVADKAEAAGVDMASLEQEYMEDGQLSEERYTELEGKGFSKSDVDEFIEYRAAKGERYTAELHEVVGGADQFEKMSNWATENWSASELKEYNASVESQEMDRAKMAMKGLRADYEKANGRTPTLLKGDGGNTASGSTYQSDAQMIKDMEDPRYRNDPAYRQDVLNKVDRTQKSLGQT